MAVFITVSIQDLRPNSQDTSAFYLENIYVLLANPNGSGAAIPSSLAAPPPFSPPSYAIWVNSLWLLSMVISLTCALLASLLLQWARRYVTITQPLRCSPHKRARIRAFFSDGVNNLHLPWAVEALPILLHLSLSSFFAGLLIFLFNINKTAFNAVVGSVGLSAALYICITLMPVFRYDSPYYAPLSSTAWLLYSGILYAVFKFLSLFPGRRDAPEPFRDLKNRYRGWVLGGVEKAAEDTASDRSSKVDRHVLEWTIGTLGRDDVLERFFVAIPGFCRSKEVHSRLPSLLRMKIRQAMDVFLDRTLSSESLSESIKISRLAICLNAAHATLGSLAVSRILGNLFDGRWRGVPRSIKMGRSLRHWCYSSDEWVALTARSIVASIIAVHDRDDRWIALAKEQFNLPEEVLRDNIPHGDSVLLVILLHVTRKLFHSVVPPWDSNILRALSQFDIHNTLPRLQHDFCALWNEIVLQAQSGRPYSTPVFILREIRHLYVALHDGTYAAPTAFSASTYYGDDIIWQSSSYPLCNISDHFLDTMPHVPGMGATHTPFASATSFPVVSPILTPVSPVTIYDVPPFQAPNQFRTSQLSAELSSTDVMGAHQHFIPVATSPNPMSHEGHPFRPAPLDIAAAYAAERHPDIHVTSPISPLMAHFISRPISSEYATSPRSEETTIIPSPLASDSTPLPPPMPTLSSEVELPSTAESSRPRSGEISRSPSSSPTQAYLHFSPRVPSVVLDPHVTASTGVAGAQNDTRDLVTPSPMEASRHPPQLASAGPDPDPGTSHSTPPSEDRQDDLD